MDMARNLGVVTVFRRTWLLAIFLVAAVAMIKVLVSVFGTNKLQPSPSPESGVRRTGIIGREVWP